MTYKIKVFAFLIMNNVKSVFFNEILSKLLNEVKVVFQTLQMNKIVLL